MASVTHSSLLNSLDCVMGMIMIELSSELSRSEATDHSVSLQVNPEFKDNTVESKGEVSQSNKHIKLPNHIQMTSDWGVTQGSTERFMYPLTYKVNIYN